MKRWSLNIERDFPCAIHDGCCVDVLQARIIRIPRDQLTLTVKLLGFGLSLTRWAA